MGGQPPEFIIQQTALLQTLAALPPADAVPALLRIAAEHLRRLEALGEVRLRQSPLQALQVPLVDALSRHLANRDARAALDGLAASPFLKEYARGRALDALAAQRLAEIAEADDPRGEQRARALLDTLAGKLTLAELLHAPARVRSLARRAPALGGECWAALAAAADTPARRYAADAALALACAQGEGAGKPVPAADRDLLVAAAGRWLQEYRPVVAREKYPSDLLGQALTLLGARPGYEALAKALRDAGLPPAP
ncbi:MAG TPA: hypothetical protein PLE19_00080 [Planctomycetota bacterium]|nr:hypothetical protein [Planctomycetota bacterium]HRR79479.1 hypothetical protein [Planctomycetota bacterium]HRT93327.1 hypothetical protein [Planctomycetota bacterium]